MTSRHNAVRPTSAVTLAPNTPLVCANTERPILPWVGAGKGYCWPDGMHCTCDAHDVLAAAESVHHLFRKVDE